MTGDWHTSEVRVTLLVTHDDPWTDDHTEAFVPTLEGLALHDSGGTRYHLKANIDTVTNVAYEGEATP